MAERLGLRVREDGPRATIEAQKQDDGQGLYRAWLMGGPEGGRYLLGTMVPDGESGVLRVKRTLSIDELRRHGVWPALEAEAELSFSFTGRDTPKGWQPVMGPSDLFRDQVLSKAAARVDRALLYREANGFSLATVFDSGKEFHLTPIFCFAKVAEIEGRLYTVFQFDGKGWPIF